MTFVLILVKTELILWNFNTVYKCLQLFGSLWYNTPKWFYFKCVLLGFYFITINYVWSLDDDNDQNKNSSIILSSSGNSRNGEQRYSDVWTEGIKVTLTKHFMSQNWIILTMFLVQNILWMGKKSWTIDQNYLTSSLKAMFFVF